MKLSLFVTLATLAVAPAAAGPTKGRELKGGPGGDWKRGGGGGGGGDWKGQNSKGQDTKGRNNKNTPSPSPYKSKGRDQPGSSSCAYSPNYACYKSGWASCCGSPGGCPSDPPCDVNNKKTTPSPTPYKSRKSTPIPTDSNTNVCILDGSPRSDRGGQGYRFNLVKSNARCTDEDGQHYEYGQIDDIDDFGKCADACVQDVNSDLLVSFRGIDFDCERSTCHCLFDEGTSISQKFESTSRDGYLTGYGSIVGARSTRSSIQIYCGKLVEAEFMGADEFLNADVTELWDTAADEVEFNDEDEDAETEDEDSKISWDDVKNNSTHIFEVFLIMS